MFTIFWIFEASISCSPFTTGSSRKMSSSITYEVFFCLLWLGHLLLLIGICTLPSMGISIAEVLLDSTGIAFEFLAACNLGNSCNLALWHVFAPFASFCYWPPWIYLRCLLQFLDFETYLAYWHWQQCRQWKLTPISKSEGPHMIP